MMLTYKSHLLTTKRLHRRFVWLLEQKRLLDTSAPEERIERYRRTGRLLSYDEQCTSVTDLHRHSEGDYIHD